MSRITRSSAVAIGVAAALLLAACGSDDDATNVEASGTTTPPATTTSHGDDHAAASDHATSDDDHADHGDADGGHGGHDEMGMVKLGERTAGDIRVEVAAMQEAVEFTVSEGGEQRKHPPAPGDNAHVMVLISDAESRDRLPDAAVTAQITGPGGVAVHNGPLYPMIGMGVGLHYGDNMKLAKSGAYRATIVVGPPQVGRHPESVDRYSKPVKLEVPFEWTAP
jgi:hypothetical protein